MSAGWRTDVAGNTAHVVPLEDLVEHDEVGCVCMPTAIPHKCEDGSIGWINKHHSLDGREATE